MIGVEFICEMSDYQCLKGHLACGVDTNKYSKRENNVWAVAGILPVEAGGTLPVEAGGTLPVEAGGTSTANKIWQQGQQPPSLPAAWSHRTSSCSDRFYTVHLLLI
jgi:hypothetical protein